MREFDLVSIDWDSVRILQAGQFKQETFFHKELVRWVLQRGRVIGVMHLEDDGISRPIQEGERSFRVTVRGCLAVAENGHIIEIPDDEALAVEGYLEAYAATVPLFVGVSKIGNAREPEIYPTIDTGLLQCGGLRYDYRLASDDNDDSYDWLQVGQFIRTANGLAPDPNYIPECVFLSSHAGLWNGQKEIQQLAAQAMDALVKNSTKSVQAVAVYAVAAALAGSLGPASRVVHSTMHPRAYIDRLAGIFASQQSQLLALPNPNLAIYQQTLNQLRDTLDYLEDPAWTLGQAILMAKECFNKLLNLYPPLLQSLSAMPSVAPTQRGDWETAIPATPPSTEQQTTGAVTPYGTQQQQKDRKGFWRR
jgi:hypothetical protein